MTDQRVQKVKTEVSEAEMARAFMDAVKSLYGIVLSKDQLALLIAQNNLETGHRKSMFNYNIGNIMHVPGRDNYDYYHNQDSTRDAAGNWKPFTAKFRSYPTLAAGVEDYVSNLHGRGGGSVWEGIMRGDAVAFSKALKRTRYYEADEEDKVDPATGKVKPGYTSGLVGSANAFKKSKSYDDAVAGNFTPSQPVATNIGTDAGQGSKHSNFLDTLDKFLDKFLSAVASTRDSDKIIKKATYKKFLPKNDIIIKVDSADVIDSLEFARILCAVLDEEAQADASIHSNREHVEVLCSIHGPKNICHDAVSQLCVALADTFKVATSKIGGIEIKLDILPNERPSYQELDIKLAQSAYRQFHLKFIK